MGPVRLSARIAATVLAIVFGCGSPAWPEPSGLHPRGEAETPFLTPVVQSVPTPPRWFLGSDGLIHLEYELLLANAVGPTASAVSVDVLNERGDRLAALSGDRLAAVMSPLGNPGVATVKLGGSAVGVVWIGLTFADRAALPESVAHRLTIALPPEVSVPDVTSTGARAAVDRREAEVIGPPLASGRWVAIVAVHRRSLLPVRGALRNGQRFAVDFSALLDAEGRTHVGSADQNASYFNYGQPVLAVAAGTVVAAVDVYPDQVPNHSVPVGLDAADGNHVIIRLDTGVFAGYAHLKPGTVRVQAGQRVQRGQILGLLGNSGNSSGPHLHFQLMDGPSLLDADGLPFTVDQFLLDGRATSQKDFLDADLSGTPVPIDRSQAGERRRQGITGLEVLTFPAASLAPSRVHPR